MPRVTEKTVDHVARLARLSLTDEERHLFARQLEEILDWAQSLQTLDTAGVPPMSQPAGASALRADSARDGLDHETVLAGAPDPGGGLFRVPRVIPG
jgi:aspartyl-tRNA(Asn)/glutamyl-tRNA(Gln) amidotransferase subunit C